MSEATQRLTFREKVGYGFGDLASCLFWSTIMSQLLFFYTDVFGLTGRAAGIMFFVSRILDAVFDVVIGMTADRTKSRWGKFRPYLLWGAIPLAVSAVLTFTTPEFGEVGKLIYAYLTFILFMFLYSTVNIPYTALLGVISGDPVDRTSASSFKFTGAYLGGIIVSATVLPLAAHFGHESVAKGWQMTMSLYAIAAVIFFFITFLSTRERIQPIAKEKTSIKDDLKDLSKNAPWMLLFAVTILFILFVCIRLSVTTHYFKYYIGEQTSPLLTNIYNFLLNYVLNPLYGLFGSQASPLLDETHRYGYEVLTSIFNTLGQGLSLVGVLLVPWFTKLVGRKSAVVILFITALVCTGSFYFLSPDNLTLIFILQVIGSITGGPISALLWVLYADTADYSEWKTGRRATGLVFSASIMSTKIGWAVGSMVAAFILDQTGFVANVVQNIDVQNGLKAMMSSIPFAVGVVALILLTFFYKLDEPTMTKIKPNLTQNEKESVTQYKLHKIIGKKKEKSKNTRTSDMQYGYFDDKNKEYVITKPDTPRSWSNYLGSTEYGAIITNNAGGYSFVKSAAQGRFTRLRFNVIPMDQPGRYLYLRDKESKDYWSASWQPVGKPLNKYKSECRHGSAYTKISSDYSSIKTETLYFVPLGKMYECWLLKVTNRGKKKRKLSLFTFVEYANNWNLSQDMINLQYSQYIMKMDVIDNIIDHGTNVYMPSLPEHFEDSGQGRHTFLAITGAKVTGFDTDRELFLGPYRTYANPLVVEKGKCTNSIAVGDNACGTLQVDIDLNPGESKEIVVIMGIGAAGMEGKQAVKEAGRPEIVRAEFQKLKEYWHTRIAGMSAITPDPDFNSMFNTWNPYNNLMTFAWSRAASLVYSGERDGLGYRDTVQDMLGILHSIPDDVRDRLELMLTGQVSNGGAMPVVKPFAHRPGYEKAPDEKEYRSDDCMWLFNTIPAYVKETGDISFYKKVLPYADKGDDTVFGHLRCAIQFNLNHSGKHGFPCGLSADWNDCLQLGQDGETTFVAFQLRYALKTYIEISELLKKPEEAGWANSHLKTLDENLEKFAWDGQWYLRAYRADGLKFGSKENDEASIFLEPQPWAVISGHTTKEQSEKLLDVVKKRLSTDYGLMINDPPVEKTDPLVIKSRLFNKGMKENASIFQHTQSWVVAAEAIIGRGNIAYDYFRKFMPSAYNAKAELRQTEPYVYAQFTNSKYSPRYGASRLPWLSGTASWAYFTAAYYILGIQPEYNGLKIDPCIPANWKEVNVVRKFRNKNLTITIRNKKRNQKGIQRILLNGELVQGNLLPADQLKEDNEVLVEM